MTSHLRSNIGPVGLLERAGLLIIALVFVSTLLSPVALAETDSACKSATSSTGGGGITACQKSIYSSGVYYFDISDGTQTCEPTGDINLTGSDNQEKAFNFLVSKGLSEMIAAAIVGNLIQESGVNPTSTNPTSGAHGIAQWLGGRLDNLKAYAASNGGKADSLGTQLDFLWYEITEGTEKGDGALEAMKKETSLSRMVFDWEDHFERAGEQLGDEAMTNRINNAKGVLQLYGGGEAAAVPDTSSTGTDSGCLTDDNGDSAPQAGKGFIGNCAGKGSLAPIHCGQCVAYVEWALGAHADPKKGPYSSLTDQSGPLQYAAATVTKNLGAKGYTVNRTPAVHATFSMSGSASALGNHWGHTGIVSQVNIDSSGKLVSIVVEQSNWKPGGAEMYNSDTVFTAAQLQKYDTTFAHTEAGWHE